MTGKKKNPQAALKQACGGWHTAQEGIFYTNFRAEMASGGVGRDRASKTGFRFGRGVEVSTPGQGGKQRPWWDLGEGLARKTSSGKTGGLGPQPSHPESVWLPRGKS